jgi:hypothetical protein
MSKSKNFKVIALILITSALLIVASNPGVKAATQDSVYIYTSLGGSITTMGSTLTGATSYNFDNGTAVDLNATAGSGFQFLCWEVVSASGATTSTVNPLAYTPDVASCAIQAMFIPTSNTTRTPVLFVLYRRFAQLVRVARVLFRFLTRQLFLWPVFLYGFARVVRIARVRV